MGYMRHGRWRVGWRVANSRWEKGRGMGLARRGGRRVRRRPAGSSEERIGETLGAWLGRVSGACEDGGLGGDADVLEKLTDGDRVGEDGDELEAAIALWAAKRIDIVHSLEKRCPFETREAVSRRGEKRGGRGEGVSESGSR